jgi:membrane-associated phospholipid phosphatase
MADNRTHWPIFLLPVAFIVAGLAALGVDVPLSQWCLDENCPPWLHDLFEIIEPYGQGIGVVLVLLAVHQLDPQRRWALLRLALCGAGAGIAADIAKMLVVRARPYHFLQPDAEGFFQPVLGGDVWSTFHGAFAFGAGGSAMQSFPSAHTATAIGLTMGLIWLYPRGRWFFAALTLLVACQRIESGAHYLSDVCFGAALGYLMATVCLRGGLSRKFDSWEAGWRASAERNRGPTSAAR